MTQLNEQERTELEQLRLQSEDNFIKAHVVVEMKNKHGNFCRFLAVGRDRMFDDALIGYAVKKGVKVIKHSSLKESK